MPVVFVTRRTCRASKFGPELHSGRAINRVIGRFCNLPLDQILPVAKELFGDDVYHLTQLGDPVL